MYPDKASNRNCHRKSGARRLTDQKGEMVVNKVEVYQIDTETDRRKHVKFLSFREMIEKAGRIDEGIYQCVYSGKLALKSPEDVVKYFSDIHKFGRLSGFYGHPMDISDVIRLEDDFYYCDMWDFKKIDFHPSRTLPIDKIRVLVVEPENVPYEVMLRNTPLDYMNQVEGKFDLISYEEDLLIVYGEGAKRNEAALNRMVDGEPIHGTFFIAGDDQDKLVSLTQEQVDLLTQRFHDPYINSESEEILDEEEQFKAEL